MYTATLDDAIRIAVDTHENQKDKSGAPYILHCLRVMMKMATEEEMIVAVLHDVLEDSEYREKLAYDTPRFRVAIRRAVRCLTHEKNESYHDYIVRVGANPLARKVKIADLEDNLNTLRLQVLSDKDLERVRKYHESIRYLLSVR